jgi:hypothetical protein
MQHTQPPDNVTKDTKVQSASHISSLRWFRREHDLTIRSLGEYLLPFFLAAMEGCLANGVLIGLAGINFLNVDSALLPFWGPFLLLLLSVWLFRRALQKESSLPAGNGEHDGSNGLSSLPGLRRLFLVIALIAVCLIWLHIYSPTYALFDPGWLMALGGDLLALNWHFYQALLVVVIAIILCWRGMRLAQLHAEPGYIFRQIWRGLLVLLVVVLLRARLASSGKSADDIVLLLLIPIFLYFSLSAHALARIAFIRREHPVGLEGNIADQERAMLSVITIAGLALLILTLVAGSFLSPAFFNALQPAWHGLSVAYDWLVYGFSRIAVIIVAPFLWLANWWSSIFPPHLPKLNQEKPVASNPKSLLHIDPISPGLLFTVKILLPLLVFLLLILLVRLTLRRRKRVKVALRIRQGDIHESVWSWSLFRQQFRAFWQAFLRRIFPRRASSEKEARQIEEIQALPGARTIREIYRALLNKAAGLGHIRRRDETPYEFQQRLTEHLPESEPQLGLITEAYTLTRYGGKVPDESDLGLIRQTWNKLDQKWEIS